MISVIEKTVTVKIVVLSVVDGCMQQYSSIRINEISGLTKRVYEIIKLWPEGL